MTRPLLILLLATAAHAGPWRRLEGLPGDFVTDLVAVEDGILAATDQGIFRIGAFEIAKWPGTLPDDRGRSVPVVDAPVPVKRAIVFRGEIWAATAGHGIWRKRVTPLFRRHAIPTSNSVNALAAAPDGSIWCGTDKGLARIADGRVETIEAIAGKALGVVTAVAVDRQGRVWVGSGSSFTGVYRRDAQGWRKFDDLDAYVHRISLDETGALWFATLGVAGGDQSHGRGAWTFAKGRFEPLPAIAELGPVRVYDILTRDPTGVLWFATLRGLAAYEGEGRVTMYAEGEKVWCLATAHDGSLWMGFQGARGAARLARGEFTRFRAGDGLCHDEVWDVVEGRPGVLWFATRGGLARYDGRRWSRFSDEDGLSRKPLWPLLSRPDGSLWIGTLGDGAVHLVPTDTEAPRTTIRDVEVDGDEVTITFDAVDAWFDTPKDQLRYRWRVDEGRWSQASAATRVTVPGGHRIEVQAIDRFGNAETEPAFILNESEESSDTWWWPAVFGAIVAVAVVIARRRRTGSG